MIPPRSYLDAHLERMTDGLVKRGAWMPAPPKPNVPYELQQFLKDME